jgi:hypothetical protein
LHNEPGLTPDLIQAVEQKVTFANKLEAPPYSVELYRLRIDGDITRLPGISR